MLRDHWAENLCLYIILIMKILGVGVDLVQNSRIKTVLSKTHARRFLHKVLH